ncbi:hypothetical protein L596_017321 [Steinernema carpocapsae]|uniref:Uncharacterized protein n=1 Tax=Steinernema carpocapsae TaxID=34508 RepID=A0A4U5N1K6_STECR|nr:hypothetical protein L596_017321 [Steinernema carpocapsae]
MAASAVDVGGLLVFSFVVYFVSLALSAFGIPLVEGSVGDVEGVSKADEVAESIFPDVGLCVVSSEVEAVDVMSKVSYAEGDCELAVPVVATSGFVVPALVDFSGSVVAESLVLVSMDDIGLSVKSVDVDVNPGELEKGSVDEAVEGSEDSAEVESTEVDLVNNGNALTRLLTRGRGISRRGRLIDYYRTGWGPGCRLFRNRSLLRGRRGELGGC